MSVEPEPNTPHENDNTAQRPPWRDEIRTPMNACSLEVLHDPANTDATTSPLHHLPLIIGCYQLNDDSKDDGEEEEGASRSGELRLHMIDTQKSSGCTFGTPLHVCETEGGVLDGKWFESAPSVIDEEIGESSRSHVYAAACSSGKICLYALCDDGKDCVTDVVENDTDTVDGAATSRPYMKPLASSHVDPDTASICLSLDWNKHATNETTGTGDAKILSSYSDGTLAVHTVNLLRPPFSTLQETHRWNAHSLMNGIAPAEVWTCCWANLYGSNDTALSGGDDCHLKGWDLRTTPQSPAFRIGPSEHDAGVTAVTWHRRKEHMFASGSYDEYVRVWDARTLTCGQKRPKPLAKVSCGGGIWRLKWHPDDDEKLLVGAMHSGCRVLNVGGAFEDPPDGESCRVTESFTCHESMAYGADWVVRKFGGAESRRDVAASCSFYDRRAFMWDA